MPSHAPSPEQPSSGLSPLTLLIASVSSVVAAVVVSRLWGPGTLVGAAVTPIIVTLVTEALRKPAEKITVVRVSATGTQVHEREAPPTGAGALPGELAAPSLHRSRRRGVVPALVTGLAAFLIGAVVLTSSELVLGDSSVGSENKRTTVFGGGTQQRTAPEPAEEEAAPATPPEPEAPSTGADPQAPAPTPSEPEPAPTPEPAPATPEPEAPVPPATGTT